MGSLETLLEQAWQTRQAHFSPLLGADYPRRTRALSLTGTDCALDCAHCAGRYLAAMMPVADLAPGDDRLTGYTSLLVSGGSDRKGRVPVTTDLERIRSLRSGRRLNWHTGLVGADDLQAIAGLVDVVSFDLVGDDATIAEVYGLEVTAQDYRETYRLLRRSVPVVPHITIGLRGGRLSGEEEALRIVQEEGAAAIVFLVLIPTPGTRYADRAPPSVETVAAFLARARLAFPEIPLVLGCMRPGGRYRRALDALAVHAGVNRIVKPSPSALALAGALGLRVERSEECCALSLVGVPAGMSPWQSQRPAGVRVSPTGVVPAAHSYRQRQNPDRVRVSAGTEAVLGLRVRPMQVAPTAAYLMLDGGGCAMACAFCAQARGSQARSDALSRIVWPDYPTGDVLAALERAPPSIGRVCLQVTVHRGAIAEVQALVRELNLHTSLPISVAVRPPGLEPIGEILAAGVDVVGLGLDCAAQRIYRQVKGIGWRQMVRLVEEACRHFPGRIRVHLMAGLGETEEELCSAMQQVYDWGGSVGLFAFTPVGGTRLAGRPQPALSSYRRVQAARFLLDRGLARATSFRFDRGGRLVDFGLDPGALLADGQAFRTSGCPSCNRPFYNERPGGTMYNYPQPLTPQEARQAIRELALPLP